MARDFEIHVIATIARQAEAEAALVQVLGAGPHLATEIETSGGTLTHHAMTGPLPRKSVAALESAFSADGGGGIYGMSVDPSGGATERWNDQDGFVRRPANGATPTERFANLLADRVPGGQVRHKEAE